MKYLWTSLLLCYSFVLWSQIELSKTNFDLGEISLLNSDIVDFDVKNISSTNVFLLRIDAEQNVGSQYTSKNFEAGAQEGIRIKLNPDKKGKVERKIKLYFSNNSEPIEITVKALVKELPKNNRTACPQFGSALKPPNGKIQPVAKIQKFQLLLYDKENAQELALVSEMKQTQEQVEVTKEQSRAATTNTAGRTERPEQTVKSKVRDTPEDRRNAPSLREILFGKKVEKTNPEPEVEEEEETVEMEEVAVEEKDVVEEEEEVAQKVTIVTQETKEEAVQQPNAESNLLDQSYKPNNIVFLIDASTSMREEQKMEILKKAMVELLVPLRDIDYITIVTYSGEAKVVLPTSKGNLKTEIALQIEDLKADGSTNAVKGIKKAIQVGKNNFLEDGNNQIFLASDGAFNIGERNMSLRKKIKKTAREGLTITVLGIKNDNWTNKSLKEIADLGNGDLIKIKSMRDADKVVKSMKRKALR
jgi:Mg-chelatase subunit ChlD